MFVGKEGPTNFRIPLNTFLNINENKR